MKSFKKEKGTLCKYYQTFIYTIYNALIKIISYLNSKIIRTKKSHNISLLQSFSPHDNVGDDDGHDDNNDGDEDEEDLEDRVEDKEGEEKQEAQEARKTTEMWMRRKTGKEKVLEDQEAVKSLTIYW